MKQSDANNETTQLQHLADRLMKCVLRYKSTREDRFLADMRDISNMIRALGYHPYFYPSSDILVVSKNAILTPSPDEHFDA
jgi:hypothetical protein